MGTLWISQHPTTIKVSKSKFNSKEHLQQGFLFLTRRGDGGRRDAGILGQKKKLF